MERSGIQSFEGSEKALQGKTSEASGAVGEDSHVVV